MKFIDSHVHFWNPDNLTYSWLDEAKPIQRAFLPTDYQDAIGDHTVEGIVFVEAGADDGQSLEEVAWVEMLKAPIKAIAAQASLEIAAGREATLEKLAARPLVKGIRRNYQAEAAGFTQQSEFIKGVQSLKKYDLSFDICIKSHQLEETIDLVKQAPDVSFILDHIAKPNIAGGEFDTWATRLKQLAAYENVVCKVSGIITEADPNNWTPEQIKPYILETMEAFGSERVMFGSDWPVVNLAGSFTEWVSTLEAAVATLSENERQKLLIDNARHAYRLEA